MSQTLGRHILVEFYECSEEILNDVHVIEQSMVDAAKEAQATVINSTFHHFSPYGVSGVVVIQESHLAIHTWPEFRYAAVDIFTCGTEVDPWIAYDYLKKAFKSAHGSAMEINRGQTDLLKRISIAHLSQNIEEARDARTPEPKFNRDVWFTDRDENTALSLRLTGEVLYRKKSDYQLTQVLDTYAYGKMLTIDNMVMCTERDEFVYHEMLTHIAMQTHPNPKKILVIGGGDGGTVRELLRYEDVEQVTMVEIDENVIEASKQHLPTLSSAFDHPKLQLLIYDGIKYLKDCTSEEFDLIIVDGSDPKGPAEGLFGEAFFKDVHRCLKSDGILCMQSEGPRFSQDAFIALHQCLGGIFGAEQVHCYLAFIPTYPSGMWSFQFASKGDIHPTKHMKEGIDDFAQKHDLQYYNEAVHRAAFALPTFVANMLK